MSSSHGVIKCSMFDRLFAVVRTMVNVQIVFLEPSNVVRQINFVNKVIFVNTKR